MLIKIFHQTNFALLRGIAKGIRSTFLNEKRLIMLLLLFSSSFTARFSFGQAWEPNTNAITPASRGSNTGIGVNNPQRLLHLGNGSYTFNGDDCSYISSNPAIRFSPTTNIPPNPISSDYCPSGLTFVNWDIEASTGRLGFLEGTNERITIRAGAGGYVGIGYTTPNFPLSFGTSVLSTKIALYEDNGNDAYGLGIGPSQFRLHLGNSAGRFSFLSTPSGGTELMTITGSGNVGIGIATPLVRLQAANGNIGQSTTGTFGTASDRWMAMGAGNVPSPTFGNFHGTFVNWGQRNLIVGLREEGTQRNGVIAWQDQTTTNANLLRFGSISGAGSGASFTSHVSFFSNGKVGIGASDAEVALGNARLYVAGNILCEEVKVELRGNWPDFVFAKDYPLLSLEQKAEYIEKNSHLPNVPSANEVASNGVELGKMDATLLRQIEELTLHMIELKKQNDLLKKQVDALNEKISKK